MEKLLQSALVLSLFLGCNFACAQNIRYAGANPTNFGSVAVGGNVSLIRTVGVTTGTDFSQITAVNVTGAGFTQIGGTCVPGAFVSAVSSCDLQLRFAPGVTGPASGNLFINCITAVPEGGVTIICDGPGGNIGLIGAAFSLIGLPTMSPGALTLLAVLMMAAMLITLRRQRR